MGGASQLPQPAARLVGTTAQHHDQVPGGHLANARQPDQRPCPVGVIAREGVEEVHLGVQASPTEHPADVQWKEADAIAVLGRPSVTPLIALGRPFAAQVVPGRRLVPPQGDNQLVKVT